MFATAEILWLAEVEYGQMKPIHGSVAESDATRHEGGLALGSQPGVEPTQVALSSQHSMIPIRNSQGESAEDIVQIPARQSVDETSTGVDGHLKSRHARDISEDSCGLSVPMEPALFEQAHFTGFHDVSDEATCVTEPRADLCTGQNRQSVIDQKKRLSHDGVRDLPDVSAKRSDHGITRALHLGRSKALAREFEAKNYAHSSRGVLSNLLCKIAKQRAHKSSHSKKVR